MARLILVHEGAVIKEYALDKERLTIGRKPSNDVQLDDPTVSGQHAVVLNLQNVYVEDLGSTNGTLLNGKRITKRMLSHGDVIKIGRHEFKYADEKAADFEKTVVISADVVDALRNASAGAPKNAAAAAKVATAAAAAPQAKPNPAAAPAVPKGGAMVKIISGPKEGQSIALNKPYTTLGSPGVQVAVIARRGSAYYLMPMGGIGQQTSPPKLNDKAIGSQSVPLKEGDVVEVAGSKLQFSVKS